MDLCSWAVGTLVGHANRPLTAEFCQKAMIKNTVSMSWRLGRAVMLAQRQGNIANVGPILVDALGGAETGGVLFAGKIIGIDRRVYKGHSIGEVVVAAVKGDEEGEGPSYEGIIKSASCQRANRVGSSPVPFKNENLYVEHVIGEKSTILATVPDLISLLDAGNGHALGTPDYKYGQRVIVIGVTAAPQWTSTDRGIELGGPGAFGFDEIPYKPLGKYVQPKSVIQEYQQR